MDAEAHDGRMRELEAENVRLRAQVSELLARVAQLTERLEQSERAAHRSAAPFRRDEKERKPPDQHGTPGRKPGHPGSFRVTPAAIDEVIDVPLARCPRCGGVVSAARPCVQHIEEVPTIRPRTTRLTTYTAVCPCCGPVRSTHPLQVSTARGSAGTHLGPRALALAAWLNKSQGLTVRKTIAALRTLCGLSISPGGLTTALERVAARMRPLFDDLTAGLREQPVVHADETGWWLAGGSAWLWVFATRERTIYRIDKHRGRDVVGSMLGASFKGVLVSDCLSAYEKVTCRTHKCYAHHLRALKSARENASESGRARIDAMMEFLMSVMLLTRTRESIPPPMLERGLQRLRSEMDLLLDPADPDTPTEKVINRLRKRKASLLTCLEVEGVDPTNNLAERQLRPAVIARKLSCGHKSKAGAEAWQTLASLAATAAQRGSDFVELIRPPLAIAGR